MIDSSLSTDDPAPPGLFGDLRRRALAVTRSVTAVGWFVIVVSALGVIFAVAFGALEYAVIGIAALVALAIALPYIFGSNSSKLTLSLASDRVRVGSGATLDVTIENTSARPSLPSLVEVLVAGDLVSVAVPAIAGHAQATVSAEVATPQRALLSVGPATMVRQDPLGMLRRTQTDAAVLELYVHPVTTALPGSSVGLLRDLDGNPTANIVDSDIAFHAIRNYAPGDARRHIHWKSTAKTGDLMVKQFEETKRSRLALLLATNPSECVTRAEFELAVSVAASLAVEALAGGRETEVLVSPPERREAKGRSQVHALRAVSPRSVLDSLTVVAQQANAVTLEHIAARAARTRANASLIVLITGSSATFRTLQQAAAPFSPDATVAAVICDPGAEPSVRQYGRISVLRVGSLADLQQLMIRGALL